MCNRLIKLHLAVFSIFLVTMIGVTTSLAESIEITNVDVQTTEKTAEVTVKTNSEISGYESGTVEKTDTAPARMFVDIESAVIKGVPSEIAVGSVVDKIRLATNENGVRIVFDSGIDGMFSYSITSVDNGILISVSIPPPADEMIAEEPPVAVTEKPVVPEADDTFSTLIEESAKVAEDSQFVDPEAVDPEGDQFQDSFSLSGFKKKKINIDFFKADLHNVFRFFREVSEQNLIVDQAVGGTVTVSLHDVPWDFALDIILNLAGLKKEERHNTIVIYPAKKQFSWPERTSLDNLEIETDLEILKKDTITVSNIASQSKERMQAKEALRVGKQNEKTGDIEEAVAQYEEALILWPDNPNIANKIASIYLVNLRVNAKAVFYAEKSLEIKPDDNARAALYAAIGSANMAKTDQAIEFFNQSISTDPPLKEALLNYAAFSENNDDFDSAIMLLDKYHQNFGESVPTLLSKARMYDAMEMSEEADNQYQLLYNSGLQLRADLKKYIYSRLREVGKL